MQRIDMSRTMSPIETMPTTGPVLDDGHMAEATLGHAPITSSIEASSLDGLHLACHVLGDRFVEHGRAVRARARG